MTGRAAAGSAMALPSRARPSRGTRASLLRWLGLGPFLAYAALFLLLPTVELVIKSFQTSTGAFSTANVTALWQPQYRSAFVTSIELSAITAAGGGLLGLFVAYSAVHGGVAQWLRPVLSTFSGVAANFAGIPLAFAFIATLGPTGVITSLLNSMGLRLYPHFTIFSLAGLSLTYLYFQFPLMILIISPSLEALRAEWREAAENLGASAAQYWRHVGLPVMLPALLGAMVLLFGNAFSAYATPYALSGGYINLVPVQIGAVLSGNVTVANPQFGDALAFGMIVIVAIAVIAYVLLQRRAARWLH
jgi:putative spermidine/putrescine transport system permease protein